ncbi:MAG: hypothetical protein ABSF96_06345 [Steroidobacteraceae bacterium]|jgi:hypothetical protein
MPVENTHDPRVVLKREKYFNVRPRPLEQWLWKAGIPSSAERVYWLHWQEGSRHPDWCSEIPIRRVAQQCCLDVSTVTRAYQLLNRLGLIRRQDPGRDPANPFQQATAVTEVLVPRELLVELDRHPNRAPPTGEAAALRASASPTGQGASAPPAPAAQCPAQTPRRDPFPGLSMRERLRAIGALAALMSSSERRSFTQAQRMRCQTMEFDEDSRLNPEQRASALLLLEICAAKPAAAPIPQPTGSSPSAAPALRQLTVFELSRLRREVQSVVGPAQTPERLREVVWSIEEGALRRFQTLHGIRIALKKLREGAWTRPNRMPPNWARALSSPRGQLTRCASAALETCSSA